MSGQDQLTGRRRGWSVKFVQYYLDCLSQASYLIGDESSGRAAVLDPRRDVQEYIDEAAADGLKIEFVIDTHGHADFLSGHLELAAATGAAIVYGAAADVHFPHRKVADGERIELGQVGLEFMATPGHTPESICIVVWEAPAASAPYGVLTGDTLFIGDVGRPDLVAAQGRTPVEMAAELYRSLHTQGAPAARRHPCVPGPRARVGLREEPLDGDGVDPRRAAPQQLRAAAGQRGGVRRG